MVFRGDQEFINRFFIFLILSDFHFRKLVRVTRKFLVKILTTTSLMSTTKLSSVSQIGVDIGQSLCVWTHILQIESKTKIHKT